VSITSQSVVGNILHSVLGTTIPLRPGVPVDWTLTDQGSAGLQAALSRPLLGRT
jgi:hypothetical protein